ncbi:DUF6624 domain-containing protein [Streptomyces albireticuli]|uniref:Uncharacterized protein n=1 Tax=Streptomyces albireticuli TaxID=1940 RepID=A0A2A2D6G6_9ACTN|nr:DUF6624 domain-containing protein [Streptomyces albireticuli]MCD9145982.1 hypothetical protein [Streptomyces albireticuli]MCD9165775.1 hypothetical protein [Streptomyces albireticuli]MCD9195993.1 hypothetical protein [Streptomyces albireticuli]PAU46912.1 hypothetical protein CK936_21685 [Streptomyces albireticuli]
MTPATRPPVRLDLLLTLTRLHREGIAVRMTRTFVPSRQELLAIVRWEKRSARELEQIFEAHGWPGPDLVGEVGAEAAWWIALLCDRQTAFQQGAHRHLLEAVERGDAPARHGAYFTDRLRMHEGVPQPYGTQYLLNASGAITRYPVADPGLLGLRCHRAGLPKVAEARPADLRLMALTRLPRAPTGLPSLR